MKFNGAYILLLAAVVALMMACDKAPNGIIKESDMVDILVDLHKAEAYVDNYPTQFPDDSTRMMLKQSVFAKHGVTQADYDTSLVWYAHNMDVYINVYRKTIDKLKNDYNNASHDRSLKQHLTSSDASALAGRAYYTVDGDTADLWTLPRNWFFTQAMRSSFITFDYRSDRNTGLGDCYELKFKLAGKHRRITSFLAVDYSDGGTAYVSHRLGTPMWNRIAIQSDSTRTVNRIYGYLFFNLLKGEIAYADSVQLLRTHLNSVGYATRISVQHIVERKVGKTAGTFTPRSAVNTEPAIMSGNDRVIRPKEGLNKSNHLPHIKTSPNERHLPHAR